MLMTKKQGALGLDSGSAEDFLDWNPKDTNDRLVIFTESVPTLRYLEKELPKRIGLREKQFAVLDGSMRDTDITKIVSDFGSAESPVRLLLCSDVASEGINLHHFAHRMIHFDMPWSLMTFQQRNGRIDRYGQEKRPQIRYMQTIADDEQARFDARILQKLQEKDEQAQKNLDDPAEFLMSLEEQENLTYARVEGREDIDGQPAVFDPFMEFFGVGTGDASEPGNGVSETATGKDASKISPVLSEQDYRTHLSESISLYKNDMDFAGAALRYINTKANLGSNELEISEHQILLQAPPDLRIRMAQLPGEVLPEGGRFNLTDDSDLIRKELEHARYTGREWPAVQLLWQLHPVMQWLTDRSLGVFGRHTAPVLWLSSLQSDERWALIQGGYPNRRGYIPIHQWIAVCEKAGQISVHTLDEAIKALDLTGNLANRGIAYGTEQFRPFVKAAVEMARQQLSEMKKQFDENAKAQLDERLSALDELKGRHEQQIDLEFRDMQANLRKTREDARRTLLNKNFNDAKQYIRDTAIIEDEPYLQLAAVFAGIPSSN